jgi:hypothetical protein
MFLRQLFDVLVFFAFSYAHLAASPLPSKFLSMVFLGWTTIGHKFIHSARPDAYFLLAYSMAGSCRCRNIIILTYFFCKLGTLSVNFLVGV